MNEHAVLAHQLGKRDLLAEVFMHIRLHGERKALRTVAQQLLDSNKENPNPHAKWYLENHHE